MADSGVCGESGEQSQPKPRRPRQTAISTPLELRICLKLAACGKPLKRQTRSVGGNSGCPLHVLLQLGSREPAPGSPSLVTAVKSVGKQGRGGRLNLVLVASQPDDRCGLPQPPPTRQQRFSQSAHRPGSLLRLRLFYSSCSTEILLLSSRYCLERPSQAAPLTAT